jgi:hypothetical protein
MTGPHFRPTATLARIVDNCEGVNQLHRQWTPLQYFCAFDIEEPRSALAQIFMSKEMYVASPTDRSCIIP